MTAEEWRPIPGFEGYAVSDHGRVASHKGKKPIALRPWTSKDGYQWVALYRDGKRCGRTIHALVAEAFLGPRPYDGAQVRHLNGDSTLNTPSNLRWGTGSENRLDSVRHGTHRNARKTHCPRDHPYDDANTYRMNGRRRCKTCAREIAHAYHQRRALRVANVRTAA